MEKPCDGTGKSRPIMSRMGRTHIWGARRGGPWHSFFCWRRRWLWCLVLGAGPNWGAAAMGSFAGGAVYWTSGVVEFLVYAPMPGGGPSYLGVHHGQPDQPGLYLRGNAREICGTEVGTPENDIVSTLSVATSSLCDGGGADAGRAVPCAAYARAGIARAAACVRYRHLRRCSARWRSNYFKSLLLARRWR